MPNRGCVYTTLIGRYEKLKEQPMARESPLPFIWLTDDPDVTSETWRVVRVRPLFAHDSVRSQRMLKLLPHRHLGNFELSLYIDNSVVLSAPPEKIFAEYFSDVGLVLPAHSFRERVRDEFVEVSAERLDDPELVAEQLANYESSDPNVLNERLYWSAVMLRNHGDAKVREVLKVWAMHVLRFSRRDQLSACVWLAISSRDSKQTAHLTTRWQRHWPLRPC
jgi:hypothetical protein